jgi:hypothetical protein
MQPSYPTEADPGLEGSDGPDSPDYVALVIEWNEEEEDDSAALVTSPEPTHLRGTIRTIAAVVGALGALILAIWGIRRVRAA